MNFDDMVTGLFCPPPPDIVPCRILGLSEVPGTRDAVKSAYRLRVKELHPDLGAYSAVPGGNEAVEAIAENDPSVQEAKWARDFLLARVRSETASERPGGVSFRGL